MKPTEEELRERIVRQISWQGQTNAVSCVWLGYLNALLEWGLIDHNIHARLIALLPPKGYKESYVQVSDELLSLEHEEEIDSFVNDIKTGKIRKAHNP